MKQGALIDQHGHGVNRCAFRWPRVGTKLFMGPLLSKRRDLNIDVLNSAGAQHMETAITNAMST